jgi:hypothetical protein
MVSETEHRTIDTARLVVVGGLHRSGTTLLADLLGAHPDVSGLAGTGVWEDEGQHLQDVYPTASDHGGPGRFAFDDSAHLTERSPLITPANRDRIIDAWRPYWDLDRQHLVEKSPPNLIRFRFLQALFPGARFVAVIRHPIPVTFATHRFYRKPHSRVRRPTLHRLLEHWVAAHDIFRRDSSSVQHLSIVRYEDLTNRPEETIERVLAELGIDRGSGGAIDAVQPNRSERYFAAWQRHLAKPVVGASRRRRAEALEERVASWGYSLFEEPR